MGGYNDLKTAIAALIRTNDNQEITGATLQSALLSIINTIGQGSVFKGVATTSTNPGSPDANVFYIAGRPGYYPNFNLELTAGLHVIENKSGAWVNTEIALDVIDAINIGGAKHVKPSQAMIIALQSVEQIPDSEGRNNAMWWSTDGNLKYKQNDTIYNLGAPAYVLYYCGDKIYKWTGSGFREIGGGGTFASGEAVSNMSIFDDGSDTDGKSSAQLAAMIPSGEVIKSLLEIISSIDTSGGSYDGVDLITTFSYDAPTRVITVKQSGRQAKTILLPLANSTNAGLMSSEDKTTLANVQSLIGKTVNSFSKSTGETGITITLVTSNGTPHAVLIPIDSELSSQSTSNLVTGAAIYNFLIGGFVYLDMDTRAYAPYTRILPLVSMGSALDNGNTPAQINTNEFRYDPTTKRIYRHNNNQQPYFIPGTSQIYLNICTGKIYKWTGSDMEEISGNGGYTPPVGGIPKTDFESSVQASLDKADTSLQPSDKEQLNSAIDNKLTQVVVNEITGAADIVTIDDADLAFIDEDGNIAMRVAEGHIETQNFDSRQVDTNATAIQQLRQQISQQSSVQTDVVVKEDDDAALDFADTAGNVVLRIAKDGQIKTKAFDSAAMNIFKQMKLDKPQCVCHGYGAATGTANTIPYFRNAVAKGYEAFECDAVNCSDGIPVCTHSGQSYSVKRKSDDETVSIQFSEITSDELVDEYTWPNGDPIALLTDVIWYLCYIKRCPLFIDGQGMNSASRKYASDYAEEIGVGEYVFHFCNGATSPIPTGVARLNMVLYPGSASDVQSMYLTYKKPNNNLMFSVNGKTDEAIRAIADAAHALGCQTYTWTFSTVESVRQQLQLGADFIITSGIVNSQI